MAHHRTLSTQAKRGTGKESLLKALGSAGVPLSPKRAAVAAGLNENSVRRMFQELLVEGKVRRIRRGLYVPADTVSSARRTTCSPDDPKRTRGTENGFSSYASAFVENYGNGQAERPSPITRIEPKSSEDVREIQAKVSLPSEQSSDYLGVPVPRCPKCGSSRISTPSAVPGKKYSCRHCGAYFNKPLRLRCTYCGSPRSRKKRLWRLKNRNANPRTRGASIEFVCERCGSMFLDHPELRYMRVKPVHIAYALYHKFCGATYVEVCDGLWQFYGIMTYPSVVHDWISRFGADVADLMADVHIPLSGILYLDEMCEPINIEDEGKNYITTDFWWLANAYDPVQDIWRLGIVSPSRDKDLAYEVIDRIIIQFNKDKRCQKLFLITDGLKEYQLAYDLHVQEGGLDPQRIVLISIPKESHSVKYEGPIDPVIINNIETFQSIIRSLTRRMRKLKVFLSDTAPQRWVDTARVHYNCVQTIRSNGIRTTRIQNVLPDFRQGRNRWQDFIEQVLKLRKYLRVKPQTRKRTHN